MKYKETRFKLSLWTTDICGHNCWHFIPGGIIPSLQSERSPLEGNNPPPAPTHTHTLSPTCVVTSLFKWDLSEWLEQECKAHYRLMFVLSWLNSDLLISHIFSKHCCMTVLCIRVLRTIYPYWYSYSRSGGLATRQLLTCSKWFCDWVSGTPLVLCSGSFCTAELSAWSSSGAVLSEPSETVTRIWNRASSWFLYDLWQERQRRDGEREADL